MEIFFSNNYNTDEFHINIIPYLNVGWDVYSKHINFGWLTFNINISWN